ncbi:hypothetical protein V8G54_024774 [Vigna mungo]|uniref:PORR domain-containing protein n=1 Tax=Vigna mungo TaxID=3915 RepID=A0AAQ3N663_VIGMU
MWLARERRVMFRRIYGDVRIYWVSAAGYAILNGGKAQIQIQWRKAEEENVPQSGRTRQSDGTAKEAIDDSPTHLPHPISASPFPPLPPRSREERRLRSKMGLHGPHRQTPLRLPRRRDAPFGLRHGPARTLAQEEAHARASMEPLLVTNLQKLLMLCVDCKLPLQRVELVGPQLGLPSDFKECLISEYPQFFTVRRFRGRDCLLLEDWDSTLAVTSRETRPNVGYLEQLERWQKLEFPSPYLNARRFDSADPKARKRSVAVIHELLSLTVEKRMTSAQLEAFHAECLLPSQLLLCLIKHQGIFYLTNKGERSTVFLKDAYIGSDLIDKCPLLQFYDKFMALCGRGNIDLCDNKNSLPTVI